MYRSELASRLTALGYEIERGRSGQPEIHGYTREYLDASSPRRQQIEAYLTSEGRQGAAAAQIAAHQTRSEGRRSHDEMQQRHQEVAERFGNQRDRVRDAAEEQRHDRRVEHDPADVTSRAVTFARDRTLERDAVVDERAILRDALQRSLGEARIEDIKREVDRRVERGDFVAVDTDAHAPGRSFTTPAMLQLEQETIERMHDGQAKHDVLASESTRVAVQQEHPHMSESQRTAVNEVLASRDQVMGLDGGWRRENDDARRDPRCRRTGGLPRRRLRAHISRGAEA